MATLMCDCPELSPSGLLTLWPSGFVAFWLCGLLASWYFPVAFWLHDLVVFLWPSGFVALVFSCGLLAFWPWCFPVAFWLCGFGVFLVAFSRASRGMASSAPRWRLAGISCDGLAGVRWRLAGISCDGLAGVAGVSAVSRVMSDGPELSP